MPLPQESAQPLKDPSRLKWAFQDLATFVDQPWTGSDHETPIVSIGREQIEALRDAAKVILDNFDPDLLVEIALSKTDELKAARILRGATNDAINVLKPIPSYGYGPNPLAELAIRLESAQHDADALLPNSDPSISQGESDQISP